ncbi:MAG: hypothetical protein J7623_28980 [Chitinophaga sp.]|uniref:hypothetical protein n=1 Tax=Chitinophaga sp. TaxID=1869181 RepID=UPI001B15E489|nr:hypothetical protein [Chitinophaga sp.]MBO9732713.1 hypothetical protein [Chitinophaga sp.]
MYFLTDTSKNKKMISRKVAGCSLFVFLLIFSSAVFAQTANTMVTDVTFDLLTWIKHVSNDVDKQSFSSEKLEQLKQGLEALKEDLTVYKKTRKVLADSLFRHNIAPGKKDPDNLDLLKEKMSKVMEGMRGVNDLVSEPVQQEGDKLNEQIYKVLYEEQGRYLSHLEAFLAGVDVTKKDLALDGSVCFTRLEECIHLVAGMEERVGKKVK